MMNSIYIKAGRSAYEIIKDGGFDFSRVTTCVGPAVGPRWLVVSGFDLALLENDILGGLKPVLLAGSSAGAWRFSAWVQPEPVESYRRLIDAYISIKYDRTDTPVTIQETISNVLNTYLEDDAIPFALADKRYRLAIATARAKYLFACEGRIQRTGFGAAFLLNAMNRSWLRGLVQRVIFYSGPRPPHFCLQDHFEGQAILLNEANFKYAVLASGAIPMVIAGIKNIYGAPTGVYRDGGLVDYHLNQKYAAKEEDITLFFHHQERIIPGWLDKKLKYRRPSESMLENVVMVYPSEGFVDKLPGGKIPDRDDFEIFVDDPKTRIKNWQRVVDLSVPLGEHFLELVESKKIRHILEKM